MGIFNTTDGTNLQMYTSAALSSADLNCVLTFDSSGTMAVVSVNDASGNLAICQFTFSDQQMNCIRVSGTAKPQTIVAIPNTNDLFYTSSISSTSLIFQRVNFITAIPNYTFIISGSDSSLYYSNCLVDLNANQIHTFHGYQTFSISSPIFLSINLTNGSPTSLLYNFSFACSAIYHMEMKDTYFYATGFCNPSLTIFMFDTTTSTFSLYSYPDANIHPYYLVLDPRSDRLINVGLDTRNSNYLWYLAKIPRYQINASPDIAISTSVQISRLASLIYTSTSSPTLVKFGVSLTNTDPTSTSLTLSLVGSSSYDSGASYNLSPYSNSSLNSNTTYSLQLVLTCTVSGPDSISYSLVSCQSSSPPSWITLDTSSGYLNFTTPCVTTQTTYTFCVSSQVAGDSSAGLKQITLTVLPIKPCSVQNCDTCVTCDATKCLTCKSGYALQSDSSICYSTDFSSSQIATLILIGITVGITAILSTVNLSSFIVIWMVFNQMRMLVLMLLTDAYFPSQVYNYLVGQKIFSFNFSFLSIHSISKLKEVINLFDSSQSNSVLQDIGLTSQSTFVNNLNLLFTLILIVPIHCVVKIVFRLIIRLCLKQKYKKVTDFLNKIIRMFELAVYLRLFIESTQFVLISAFSELRMFNTNDSFKIGSLCIAFMFAFIVLAFCVIVLMLWINKAKQETLNCNECWFGEVFKDSKNNFCARSYTLISICRTVLLTAFLLLTNNYQDNLTRLASSKVYYLFVVQLVYTIATFAIRPLDKIEANLTLLVNESIFLILCCLLMYFNIQSRWNDAIVNVFQYIITANGMIVTLIVTIIGIIKLCIVIKSVAPKLLHQNSAINIIQPEQVQHLNEEVKYEKEPIDSTIFKKSISKEHSSINSVIPKESWMRRKYTKQIH